ncbi:maltase-glucoamylase-like [Lytechinus pictus]|uniref:maltase-glucoamylase-like n=1 Tax=Lytechinus pictus TaxID=7653 RepID=UPI0030B9B845
MAKDDFESLRSEAEKKSTGWTNPRVIALLLVAISCAAILCTTLTFFLHPDQTVDGDVPPFEPLPTDPDEMTIVERINCYPDRNAGEAERICLARGCEWQPTVVDGAPYCFFPRGHGTYRLVLEQEHTWGMRLTLERETYTPSFFGQDIQTLTLDIEFQSRNRLHFKFYDASKPRFEVPIPLPPRPNEGAINTDYAITYTARPFTIKITRKSTGEILWDTSIGALIFEDQFLSISTRLPSSNLYGFGESEHRSFKHDMNWRTWGLFARDQPPGDNINLYGVHPFYMNVEYGGNAHGVLFFNLNAQDFTVQPTPALTYRTVGGILDFYMFLGPTPDHVIQQYTELVGRPMIPPYWALGYHLSRYGYENLDNLQKVVASMREYDIPHDVQYSDIDYMKRNLDFTLDEENFGGLGEFVESIKAEGTRYIIMLDPAISANETGYEPYDLGVDNDVFIKDEFGDLRYGKVWPDYPNITVNSSVDWDTGVRLFRAYAVFPDYRKQATKDWWIDQITKFKEIINFDGLWLDMNEPANFVHGSVDGCSENIYDLPPYVPRISGGGPIYDKTICMNSVQQLDDNRKENHYNMHSLYGWSQTIPTVDAVQQLTGMRSLVVTRSTVPSSGTNSGHWLGDNGSNWPQLRYSIIGTLEFNLFGVPHVGADICGFFNDSPEDLCRRWHQVGAFYPYARNHNGIRYQAQDPGSYGEEFAVSIRELLHIRYRMLPYLYTLFYDAHTQGSTVVRSLMHEFTHDSHTWGIDRQFMWGSALLISPVLEEDTTVVRAYFPQARWYDYYEGMEISVENLEVAGGIDLVAPRDVVPLHFRGGYIIPTQQPHNCTKFSRLNPFGLIVPLDESMEAAGDLFWDDGDSIDTVENGDYYLMRYIFSRHILTSSFIHVPTNHPTALFENLALDDITIYGLETEPSVVKFNGGALDASSFEFKAETKVLSVKSLDHPMTDVFTLAIEFSESP